jgi:beta-barrel assembly-enhancing protease
MLRQKSAALVILLLFVSTQPGCGGLDERSVNSSAAPGGARTTREPSRVSQFKPGWNLFEPEEDIELGKQSADKLAEQVQLAGDREVVGYIEQLGARLVKAAPGFDYPYEFRVIASKEMNAFALPGGIIFVNAGAILAAKNEGELAGILAHEIAHVALRHGTEQASKRYVAVAGKEILDRLTGGSSTRVGKIINSIGGAGANVLFLKFGRDSEREADIEGARIMSEVGYDPVELANFFQRLESEGEAGGPEFLNDHPNPGNRVAAIKDSMKSLRVDPDPIRNTADFGRVKSRLASGAIPLGESSRPARTGPENN